LKQFILGSLLFSNILQGCDAQGKTLKVGDTIPAFSLRDQNNNLFSITEYIGRKILVIYFYPKDESMVCTREACSFRDNYKEFDSAGAMVIGINSGSVESHRNFAKNHQLPFTLLSDPDNQVLNLFGVKKKFFISGRETFVVDKTGKIVFTYNSMTNGPAHEKETLAFIKKMGQH
jgi:thioredoxin-dependent peroxiredoxin